MYERLSDIQYIHVFEVDDSVYQHATTAGIAGSFLVQSPRIGYQVHDLLVLEAYHHVKHDWCGTEPLPTGQWTMARITAVQAIISSTTHSVLTASVLRIGDRADCNHWDRDLEPDQQIMSRIIMPEVPNE